MSPLPQGCPQDLALITPGTWKWIPHSRKAGPGFNWAPVPLPLLPSLSGKSLLPPPQSTGRSVELFPTTQWAAASGATE